MIRGRSPLEIFAGLVVFLVLVFVVIKLLELIAASA